LGQTGRNKERQAPQALGLGGPPPKGKAALKIELELTLKLVSEERVMLGGTQ
jgi:hypothetical protein